METECPHFPMRRGPEWSPNHPDSQLGDNVPHIKQIPWRKLDERTPGGSAIVCVDGRDFFLGKALDEDNNCLIDTLRQKLNVIVSVPAVRQLMQQAFPSGPHRVTSSNFLELQHHWRHVVQHLGTASGGVLNPVRFRVVCIDMAFPGNGDVEGDGPMTLHIAREHANHFVPLFPYHGPRLQSRAS